MKYAFVTCQTTSIEPENLPAAMLRAQPLPKGPVGHTVRHRLGGDREQRQKQELIGALQEAEGNQSRAAEIPGISRVTVWNRMKRYGVRAVRRLVE